MAAQVKQDAKKQLRDQVKQNLASLSEENIAGQSEKAQDVVLSLDKYKFAKRVGIYLSMPKAEAQTDRLVRDALRNDKSVFVPYIYSIGTEKPKRKIMEMLRLHSVEEYEGLERDSWGIPKLPKHRLDQRENAMGGIGPMLGADEEDVPGRDTTDTTSLDVIVVPGVAFDDDMNRMGHGAGFYDMFLTRFCSKGIRKRPFLVGLCLAEQVLPTGQLIMEDWDWKVDAVAVGDGNLLASEHTP